MPYVRQLFAQAVGEAEALEARARGKPRHAGAPSLTLTQVYSLCREHQLLCAPLHNLQALRRWLIELKEFKPSLASRGVTPVRAPPPPLCSPPWSPPMEAPLPGDPCLWTPCLWTPCLWTPPL